MRLLRTFIVSTMTFFVCGVYAQQLYINENWDYQSGLLGNFKEIITSLDIDGNVVCLSNNKVGSNSGIYLNCRHANGNLAWQITTPSTFTDDDYGIDLKIDGSGNNYFVAAKHNGNDYDVYIEKHTKAGALLWSQTYNGSANSDDIPTKLILDQNNDLFIIGSSIGQNSMNDYLAMKIDGSTGTIIWDNTYDFNHKIDVATGCGLDNSGNLVVVGAVANNNFNSNFVVVKYDANGNIVATKSHNSPGNGYDLPFDLEIDQNDNIYVVGTKNFMSNNGDIKVIAYNPNLQIQWVNYIDKDGSNDEGYDLKLHANKLYVTGFCTESNSISLAYLGKMDCVNGNIDWSKERRPENGIVAKGKKIDIDNNGNIFVVGEMERSGASTMLTSSYDQNGNVRWEKLFKKDQTSEDFGSSIIISNSTIYSTGASESSAGTEITTVQYTENTKVTNYTQDSSGASVYEANDLIVKFDTSAINMRTIDRLGLVVGTLEDFLKPNAASKVREALTPLCGERCDIRVFRLFRSLTTADTATTSRLGATIKIPSFWSALLFEFPDGVDVTQAQSLLENIYPTVHYSNLNLAGNLHSVPDDDLYSNQYSLHDDGTYPNSDINVEQAWDIETGKSHVRVGVYDSGLAWEHPDFGNMSYNGTNVKGGWDFENYTSIFATSGAAADKDPAGGHGTQVGGIIAARRNNSIGVAGIAGGAYVDLFTPLDELGVSLYGSSIYDSQAFTTNLQYIYDALVMGSIDDPSQDYAFGLNIMNHSWGIDETSGFTQYYTPSNLKLLTEAVHFANRANVTFVASRGNQGEDLLTYPVIIDDDWVLNVGGTGIDGKYITNQPPFANGGFNANFGHDVDVSAPGDASMIKSVSPTGYSSFSGTSASAPHVSGVAGLLMSYLNKPYAHPDNMAPEDVEHIIQVTAVDENSSTAPGYDDEMGYGRLDAGAALSYVDKSQNIILKHFGTTTHPFTSTITQVSTGDVVELTEFYENENSTTFQTGTQYTVNKYQVDAYVDHQIPAIDNIIDYWPRPSSSTVFADIVAGVVEPRERLTIESINLNQAHVRGYVYEVFDMSSNFIGWWPADPNVSTRQLAYTVLVEDLDQSLSSNNFEDQSLIVIYPNPTKQSQTISIKMNKSNYLSVELYDIQGKLIKEVAKGNHYSNNNVTIQVELDDLSNGIYIYKITIGEETYHEKIIVE